MAIVTFINKINALGIKLWLESGQLKFKAPKGVWNNEIRDELVANKADVITFLETLAAEKNSEDTPLIQAVNRVCDKGNEIDKFPLSFSQERLWFIEQMGSESASYNIPWRVDIRSEADQTLNISHLEQAFNVIISRHENLRTIFPSVEGEVQQQVLNSLKLELEQVDISHIKSQGERDDALHRLCDDEARMPFNLQTGPLLKAKIFKLHDAHHVLVVNMHHIVSDGWSMGVFVNEFNHIIQALEQGRTPCLPELTIQYADYSVWQRAWLDNEVTPSNSDPNSSHLATRECDEQQALKKQFSYWQSKLEGVPEVLNFPTDFARPYVQSFSGSRYNFSLGEVLTGQLKKLAEKQGCTLYMLLLSVFKVMLYRCSNQEDICIGTPVANRHYEGTESLIGMFINTLVLRNQVKGRESFTSLLAQVKATCLEAFENQDVPFEKVVELSKVSRNSSVSPLFQMMFLLQNTPKSTLGDRMQAAPLDLGMSKFDVTLVFNENSDKLEGSIEYRNELFTKQTIKRLARYFHTLCEAVVFSPEVQVNQVALADECEKNHLLMNFNQTQADYPKERCIHEWFEQQVMDNPDSVAVVFGDKQLTYQALNDKANQLAHHLIEQHNVTPDTHVGLCVERSLEMVIGLLGVLKAGGAYVPLDPSYPESRLTHMIADADLKSIVSHTHLRNSLPYYTGKVIYLDEESTFQKYSTANVAKSSIGLTSSHLAYLIYTSGSTGRPKGVMVEHRSVSNYFTSINGYPHDEIQCSVMSTSLNFDATVTSLFGSWLKGGYLKMLNESRNVFEALQEAIQSDTSTLFKVTPAHLKGLELPAPVLTRHVVVIGGEALAYQEANKIAKMLPNSVFINEYGPTEATVGCCVELFKHEDLIDIPNVSSISIGIPLLNTQLLVLDSDLQLAPLGAIGELFIGGEGLARGYLNRASLTAERFVNNPFYNENTPNSSKTLYRTGDLVRHLPDGKLTFMGRIDDQVKIRGFRVELEEVESQLVAHDGVDSALVITKELGGIQQLLAYIKPAYELDNNEQAAFLTEVKASMLTLLPEYMVPSVIMSIDIWPLTPNGKVDKKSLPEPDLTTLQGEYLAPQTTTEKMLVEIWSELLGLEAEKVSRNANFFELGGHSLLVMTLVSKAQKAGLNIEVKNLFSTPNLMTLASVIESNGKTHEIHDFKAPTNLIPADCQAITPQMLPLISLSPSEIDYITLQVPGGAENIEDIYPLGPLQAGILYTHKMSQQNDPYVLPMLFEVSKEQAVHNFINGIEHLIQRHDVLRTLVISEGLSEPVQVVCRQAQLSVNWLELNDGVDVKAYMTEQSLPENQWIDLTKAPLLHLEIAKGSLAGQFFLLLRLHHIINDHVGLEIIHRELNLISEGKINRLSPVRPYRDFIAYTSQQLKENKARNYFEKILGDVVEPTVPYELFDINRDGSCILESREFVVDDIAQRIRQLSKQFKFSPASLFHAAFSLVVGACSNKSDVVFGSVMSGRLQGLKHSENMLGVFINTLPVRIQIKDTGVLDFVISVQRHLHELLEFEQTPLSLAQSCSAIANNTPVFSAMLNYRHSKLQEEDDNSSLSEFELISSKERNNYPFNLSVDDYGVGFALNFKVDSSIDVARVMRYMHTALQHLVVSLTATPSLAVSELTILPNEEQQSLLNERNNTVMEHNQERCIHELFEQLAKDNPDKIAVSFEGEKLTYSELNQRANRLAHFLVEKHGIKTEALVGLCIERSLSMVVGILAVLKAGGAYVPLDPSYPQERLDNMIEDAGLTTILSHSKVACQLQGDEYEVIELDNSQQFQAYRAENIDKSTLGTNLSNLAYVIYTSGSTGKPKGVMVEHKSLLDYMLTNSDSYYAKNLTGSLVFSSLSFDLTLPSIYLPLIHGDCVELANNEGIIGNVIDKLLNGVDDKLLRLTPSHLQIIVDQLGDAKVQNSHTFVIGGEALDARLVMDFYKVFPESALINHYGPSESTIGCSYYKVCKDEFKLGDSIPIGRGMKNTQVYVLNHHQKLAPDGVLGELYVGGDGLARGYLNRPELTSERFIHNPYYEQGNAHSAERLYRTGDLVRYLPDGNLEFCGRADDQVKVRGFRIELGEVEAQLSTVMGVDSALVKAQSLAGAQQLIGYVKPERELDEVSRVTFLSDVKAKLASQLPDYMVPSVLMVVTDWPLTPNGKVDKKALPQPDGSLLQGQYVAPETEIEIILAEIWSQLLEVDVEKISITANFFELGGHSILVMRMNSMIKQKFGVDLAVSKLFFSATIESIAEACARFMEKTELEVRLSQHDEKELEEVEF